MAVRKYKIDVPSLPAAEIDPQGEYSYRDPATGAAALMAPTREGDALVPLLGGFTLQEIGDLRAKLDIILALGRDGDGRLTDAGVPLGGGAVVPPADVAPVITGTILTSAGTVAAPAAPPAPTIVGTLLVSA